MRWKSLLVLVGLAIVALVVVLAALGDLASAPASRVTAWATVFEAGVLLAAALFAGNQLLEMRQTRITQTRPYVIAYLTPDPIAYTVIDFVVANVGKSVARDIKFTFEPTLSDKSGPHASFQAPSWVALESGLPTLAPGQQISCLWAQSTILINEDPSVAKRHTVTIRYSGDSPAKGPFIDPYVLDVGSFRDLVRIAAKTLDDEVRL